MQNTQCCAPFELPSLYREILSLDSSRLLRRQGIVLFEQMRDALYLILMPSPLTGAQFELQGSDMPA